MANKKGSSKIASNLLLVALHLVNEKIDQIRAAGCMNYMNNDLPDLRLCIIEELRARGEWDINHDA